MIHLVLSLDYEIFGNGAGDVRRDMIEPTNRLLDICDKHGAKLTIMFEVAEYWAFKEAERQGRLRLGYSPSQAMEEQARDAVQRGHDVQLHLHPQWIGAEISGGALWHLKFNQWAIAEMPHGVGDKGDILSITGALYTGRRTLEDMLRPVRSDYECLVFRAGDFCIQPAGRVIKAMKNVGLLADSSVVKGYRTARPHKCDFLKVPYDKAYWWTTSDDVCREGSNKESVLEIPVFSDMKPFIYNMKLRKLLTTMGKRRHSLGDIKQKQLNVPKDFRPMSKKQILMRILSRYPRKLDLCKLSLSDMKSILKDALRLKESGVVAGHFPLVGIAHGTDFWNDKNLESFLRAIHRDEEYRGKVVFSSLSDVLHAIYGNDFGG